MKITIHVPTSPLDTYIGCMWYGEGSAPFTHLKILPMPSLHLMINFGDPYHVYNLDGAAPFATCAESWSVGLWNAPHTMSYPTDMRLLNVSFKPGGAYPFLLLPLSELHNQIVSLDAIWGSQANEVRERLYNVPTVQGRFSLLEQLLRARLREESRELNTVQYAIDRIASSHGVLSIRNLSLQMGISQKHLIGHFSRLVGATPKEVARIYRFKHVLYGLDLTKPVEWTQVAFQASYYDQSHFNKDFEAFTGHSPSGYLKLLRQVQVEDPELAQYPQHLPAS